MTYHWIVPLLAVLASLALAILVNRSGPRTATSRAFTFVAISLVFWNLIYVVFYSVQDVELAFAISRVFRSGAVFLFPAVLHLVIVLPDRPRARYMWALLVLDYAVTVCFVIANALGVFVTHLQRVDWGYYSVGTVVYDGFAFFVLANFLAVFAVLIYEYATTTEPRMRLQLKFWLLGATVALPLGLTNFLPVYGIPLYPTGNLGSAAFAGIVAYAIVRHRLMDIEVVITKGIAYVGVISLIVGPAFVIGILMQKWAFGEINPDFSAALLILLLAMGILFPVARSRAESRLERSLFREKQQSRATLRAFAKSIVRILDRERLIHDLCDMMDEVFDLDRVSLFMLDGAQRKYEVGRHLGVAPVVEMLKRRDPFIQWLGDRGEPVLAVEGQASPSGAEDPEVSRMFHANGWDVCVPLVSSGGLIGFLGLGRRRNLEAFAAGDLDILGTVAAQATIAFENARLYDELRRSQEIINRAGRLSALGTLAAGIAHEIRNPLVSIQTFFQLAPQRLHDEEFMSSFLKLADGEVQRIRDLISELLSFAKSPSAAIGDIDLGDVIDRTAMLLVPHARSQQVELIQEESKGGTLVQADPDQIMQVLINIVLNGIQATPAGGTVTVALHEVERDGAPFCRVDIQDTGAGIPPDIQESIFNPFFTTKDKGTGLGLAIAHRIVTDSGGFIEVESCAGEGTQFSIHLPSRVALAASAELPPRRLHG